MHALTIGRCLVFFSVTIISILFLTLRANNRYEYTLLWRVKMKYPKRPKLPSVLNSYRSLCRRVPMLTWHSNAVHRDGSPGSEGGATRLTSVALAKEGPRRAARPCWRGKPHDPPSMFNTLLCACTPFRAVCWFHCLASLV